MSINAQRKATKNHQLVDNIPSCNNGLIDICINTTATITYAIFLRFPIPVLLFNL